MLPTHLKIGALPRDIREDLFNLHAVFSNPEAVEREFYKISVPTGTLALEDLVVSAIPHDDLKPYIDADPRKLPPLVIADGKLLDGQHRISAARALGLKFLSHIDVSGIINPDACGFICRIPTPTTP